MLDKKLILGLLFVLAALSSGCTASIVEMDNIQERLDKAAPLIGDSQTIGQTFVSHHPRLSAVELLLVVYPPDDLSPDAPQYLTFHLRSDSQNEADLVTLTVDTSNWKHNDPYTFSFPPQADSENKTYWFLLESTEGNRATVWYNSLDAYGEGTFFLNSQSSEGDLYFKTYYDYNLASMALDVWRGLVGGAWLILPLLALLILPGYLFYSLLPFESEMDPLEHLALVVGLSLALAPLSLLCCSVLGIALNGARVLIATVVLSIGALWRLASTGFREVRRWRSSTDRLLICAFLFVFLVSLLVRFFHIRNLVLPAWIDSVHHTLISQLIVAKGGIPQSYEPVLPIGEFVYHFGFHALVAAFHWLTDLEVPRAVLVVGQVINGIMVLSAYLLVKQLTGHRLAGLFGALIVGVVSLMPAYYVSWGRYTQLTGLALLPTAVAFTVRGLGFGGSASIQAGKSANWETDELGHQFANLLIAAASVAGLFLTHYRVLMFYGCFVLAYLLCKTFDHRGEPAVLVGYWGRATIVCLAAALLTLPWIINLIRSWLPLTTLPSRLQGAPSFNVVPYDLIMLRRNRELIALSMCGLIWGLHKRERGVIVTVLWIAITVWITNPSSLGFSSTWLVNNASLVISLFVPFAILGGYFLAYHIPHITFPIPHVKHLMLAIGISIVVLWGAGGMLSIVNPATVLATRDDMVAIGWVRRHVPSDARFLINVRHWQGATYVGADGGYWIPLLAGQDVTLPPAIYTYGSFEYAKGVNDLAEAVIAVESFDAESTRQLLNDSGVTHVYIGARGGSITPQMLLDSPYYRPVFSNGAVWIFRIEAQKNPLGDA